MITHSHATLVTTPFRCQVTIPGAGATIRSLLPRLPQDGDPVTLVILGRLADGTDRVAITVASPRPGAAITGTDYSTHGQHAAAGEDYTCPAVRDLDSYVRAAVDSPAVLLVLW